MPPLRGNSSEQALREHHSEVLARRAQWDQQGWPHSGRVTDKQRRNVLSGSERGSYFTISRWCAYAATAVRLAKASGTSLRSDGATVSNGFLVYPISCATHTVGIC